MGRTACTEPQCLYKGAVYLTSVPVQGCSLPYLSACTRAHFTLPQCLYKGALYLTSVPVQGRTLPVRHISSAILFLFRLIKHWVIIGLVLPILMTEVFREVTPYRLVSNYKKIRRNLWKIWTISTILRTSNPPTELVSKRNLHAITSCGLPALNDSRLTKWIQLCTPSVTPSYLTQGKSHLWGWVWFVAGMFSLLPHQKWVCILLSVFCSG